MEVPSCSSKQMIGAALRLGFRIKKGGKGSHAKLEYASGGVITVPHSKDIGKGLRTRIVDDMARIAGKDKSEVIKLLSTAAVIVFWGTLKSRIGF